MSRDFLIISGWIPVTHVCTPLNRGVGQVTLLGSLASHLGKSTLNIGERRVVEYSRRRAQTSSY